MCTTASRSWFSRRPQESNPRNPGYPYFLEPTENIPGQNPTTWIGRSVYTSRLRSTDPSPPTWITSGSRTIRPDWRFPTRPFPARVWPRRAFLNVKADGFAIVRAQPCIGTQSQGEAFQIPGTWNPIRRIRSESLASVRSLSKTGSELSSIRSGFPSSYALSSHPKALSLSDAAA
jgi:hypothetical protein